MMDTLTDIWIIRLNQAAASYIFTDQAMLSDPTPRIL